MRNLAISFLRRAEGALRVVCALGAVGAAGAFCPAHAQLTIKEAKGLPYLSQHEGKSCQSVALSLVNDGDSAAFAFRVRGLADQSVAVGRGASTVEVFVPEHSGAVSFSLGGVKGSVSLEAVRKMTIYILPHSHNDIGYTEIQTNVERKQMNNLLTGIRYWKETKDYPAGARFVWNLEGVYAADLFLHRMSGQQQQDFIEAVRQGGVSINGMYVNTLTGLCRPEELLQLFHRAGEVAALAGGKVDAAMISDVPGYTWGTVTAMAQAGIKYFSVAPNFFDRIGDILVQWQDKPFYWVSPSGTEKVLVWIPYMGYALSHTMPEGLTRKFVADYIAELGKKGFNYDISYIRWSGHGDNAVPDKSICEFVKYWNTTYTWPKFIISSTSDAFRAFEDKYGAQLPREQGDWTGYWEDGAGSSAFETAENRATSARLTQAEALWAMRGGSGFPVSTDREAWKNVILYSEHTWGADVSITRPLSQKTMEQWIIKKSYATQADSLSLEMVRGALSGVADAGLGAIDVYNTHSWAQTGLVTLSSAVGDKVTDDHGTVVPSQRLSSGELAFVASDVPPFGARRYTVSAGAAAGGDAVRADGNVLDNGVVRVAVDERTGAVVSLTRHGVDNEFADTASGGGLNDYLFLKGNNLKDIERNGPVKITVSERGPVLAELRIESQAPGVANLVRTVRLVKGFDFVEVSNILDKLPAELDPHPGDYQWANLHGKESLNIGFPFHVPDGQVRLDIPMAVMRPEQDQIPGSCKNWLEVGNWADVSNGSVGVTLVTLDAPLVEVGGITATMLGGQTNPAVWRKHIEPTQKIYSWALNNHWETNYRAYQDGIIRFRYALEPHGGYDPVASTRLATGLAEPLIASAAGAPVASGAPAASGASLLRLSSDRLVVLSLRPSRDGKALMVTLYNPTAVAESTGLTWGVAVGAVHLSNTDEETLDAVAGPLSVAGQDVVTVRVER